MKYTDSTSLSMKIFLDTIDVTTCSLDDPERVPPTDHTYASNKLSWVKLSDQLAEHQESRQKG